ncbi:MAG TPA: metallophosphoesterase, partial [Nitrososphaerales archaeon]|nr:metallophosphoesterase [Nitrososphaerales archaeon]
MKPNSSFERVLVVGDPHLKVSRIDDSREFLRKLVAEATSGKHSKAVILGDLFDTFAVIRSEVLSIWFEALSSMSERLGKNNLILLVGNHDYAGVRGGSHALEPFRPIATVVDQVTAVEVGGAQAWFMPFVRDNGSFEEVCREIPAGSVLFCHQSFNGAQFENGFYDPHGANPECVAHLSRVVSGHVHTRQAVGENIWYPGTPFQQGFGEA